MNVTAARPSLTPEYWDDKFFTEYVRANKFARYMGKAMSDMIQVKEDLERRNGDTVNFATVHRAKGAGVTGNQLQEGNEELLDARGLKIKVGVFRHAMAVTEWDEQKSAIDLRDAMRDALIVWELEKMKADLLLAFTAITGDGNFSVPYVSATPVQRDAWQANNADRVLFGAAKANRKATHALSLAELDGTADKMTAGVVSLAKRIAKNASPRIRPITVKSDGTEWFVFFINSWQMRDLRNDPQMYNALKDAETRGRDNPLFAAGDLVWDGVIIREIEELPVIEDAGAGGIDVGPALMCGAQALGVAWAQRFKSTTNVRDYGFVHGVGIQEMRGIDKMRFGTDPAIEGAKPVDQGMTTVFTASVPDA